MRRLLTVLVLLGVALRMWAYLADGSFWLDEILLSRNIVGLPLGELLTQPLKLDQVAPRGFLLAERLSVVLFGENELALRLFPFLSGVVGLVLFRRLAERTLDGWGVPFALALCAIAVPFLRYGAEVKQYEVDATATILLLLLALDLRQPDASTQRLVWTGLAGLGIVLFSQASVLVMAGIGLAFAVQWLLSRDRSTGRALVYTMPLWAMAALLAIAAGFKSMTPSTREFMYNFWRPGFFPRPMKSPSEIGWFWDQALTLFTDRTLLRYRWPAFFLIVALLGVVATWRARRDVALLLLGPLFMAAAAAVAHQYPFRGRLILYLVPILFLAIACGAEWMRSRVGRYQPALGAALMLALLLPPVEAMATNTPPYDMEHHRVILDYLKAHRRPGDMIHTFPLTRIGLLYYGPRYGLEPVDWRTGICSRDDTRAYLRDVDRYRGAARVWLLSSRPRPFRVAVPAVRSYLATIGVRRDSLALPSLQFDSVTVDLYDLSDSTRLRAATAETFSVDPMPTDPAPGCRPWIQPGPLDSLVTPPPR
jgi:Dolichyl-phosphate-mannose-protein mannosyltransferase